MKKPPQRHQGVPQTAEWKSSNSSWEDGPRGARGRHGAWTAWRSDDGSVLWKGRYLDGKIHGDVTYFDHGDATMIVTWVHGSYNGLRTLKKPAAAKRKRVKVPKLRGTPYERLTQLDEALRGAKHEDYARVAWKKIRPADVAKAEKKLRTKLPPSYVAFVKAHGVFDIRGTDGEVYNRLLAPLEIAKITLALRRAGEEFLDDGLCFQGNVYDDNFYAFRVGSRRKDGEMTVGEWNHDDDSVWPRRFKTFDEHIGELCAHWCDELA